MGTCIGEYYVVIVLGMKTYYKPMGLYSGGLTIGERFANEIWGVLYSGGLISGGGRVIGILWFVGNNNPSRSFQSVFASGSKRGLLTFILTYCAPDNFEAFVQIPA